ncbi:CDP-glycerol glycerophosphotransferase family protein [Listeria aquatica]|uniref:CDP-glycerol glycerophosphotransferase family protein n=1 Tax=Listeria aquatica TaxID=1494960 RepID=UPI003EF8149D
MKVLNEKENTQVTPDKKHNMLFKILTSLLNIDLETAEELFEEAEQGDQVIEREITDLSFNNGMMMLEGNAHFFGKEPVAECEIEKYLIIKKGEKKVTELRMRNLPNENMFFSGYKICINFNKFENGNVLSPGCYEIMLKVKQFIDDKWIEGICSLGNIKNQKKDFIVSSEMQVYTAKINKVYRLIVELNFESQKFIISSKKLSEVEPSLLQKNLVQENRFLIRIKKIIFKICYFICKLLPVQKNKIVFASDSRIDVSGNFEYIYEAIKSNNLNFNSFFFLKESVRDKKTCIEFLKMAYHFATSRYIILDDYYPLIYPMPIRKKTDLIQVWHAAGAFKTFGYSRVGMPGGPKGDSIDHKNYTKAIVSSSQVVDKYAEGFGIDKEKIYPIGVPRTDVFFDSVKQQEILTNLNKEMPFLENKKVILFAPTFRGNGQQSAYYPFEYLNFKAIYDALHKKGWIMLLKIHPFVQNTPSIPYEYKEFYFDVSEYREINNLLLVTDVLITDYSSVCFEYALLKRKMVFYSPDLAEYTLTRNFYYEYLGFIPGSFATTTEELIESIQDEKIDYEKLDSFISYFFEDQDGNSADRFVQHLANGFYEEELDGEVRYSEEGKWIPAWGEQDVFSTEMRKSRDINHLPRSITRPSKQKEGLL